MLKHAVVLLKQILDPELPPSRFRIDPGTRQPAAGIGPELLGPFEENALEVVLALRDTGAVGRVTALAVGSPRTAEALRRALSLRVDEAVLVSVAGHEALDPIQIAELLTRAIQRLDQVELVVAGRQGGDWDHGQTGSLVAERLGWPCLALVQRVSLDDQGHIMVRRERAGAEETLSARPPLVVTVTNHDSSRLRMARVVDVLAAGRKPLQEWTAAELGLDEGALGALRRLELLDLRLPVHASRCELVQAASAHETASALVRRLEELKLLTEQVA